MTAQLTGMSEFNSMFNEGIRVHEECLKKKSKAINQINVYIRNYAQQLRSNSNKSSYLILNDVIKPYYESCIYDQGGATKALIKLFQLINDSTLFKVIFLGQEVADASSRGVIHVLVDHVALLPRHSTLKEAENAWKRECGPKEFKIVALPSECIEWKNHWVFLNEIRYRISTGDGQLERKEPLLESVSSSNISDVAEKTFSRVPPVSVDSKEKNKCGICTDKEINCVIIPCGHLQYCLDCIEKVRNCPTCRASITGRVKTFK